MSSIKLKGSSSGDVTITVPAAAGTNTVTIPAATGNLPLSNLDHVTNRPNAKPLIINGDMQVAQKGTSTTGITSSTQVYTTDTWRFNVNALGTWTVTQADDAPTGSGFQHSWKADCTTADASPSAADYVLYQHRFEGQDVQLFKKGTSSAEKMTVSFWVKSAKTGTYILEIDDNDNSRNINQAYTISSADTWEKKVLSFDADTTGAFDNDNAHSMRLVWWLAAGTDFTSGTLATSWASTTNANRAVGQVNLGDSTSNDWYITGVQLEVGEYTADTIPPFQHESFGDSLLRCQRYLPAYIGTTSNFRLPGAGIAGSTTLVFLTLNHPVTTRVKPSGVVVSDAGHWSGGVDGILANQAMGSVAYGLSSTFATRLTWAVASGTPFTARDPAYIEGTNTSAVLYLTGCEL